MPEISIVLPTYNGEQYISQSIDSILKQTFPDWELIVVNDCSTDRTLEIVKQYAEYDHRIKIIDNNINKKLPNSLNIGFQHSCGSLLTWTSDDNLYHENALEIMKNELEKDPSINMVRAGMINIDETGEKIGLQPVGEPDMLYFHNNIGACFMYRRIILEEIGEYDADLFLVEDYDYWLRIIEHYSKIKSIKEPLYYYRRHKNSLTETKKTMINNQIRKLKDKHIPILLNKFERNPSMICQLYLDYYGCTGDLSGIDKYFFRVFPPLKYNRQRLNGKGIIILGAGNIGCYAQKVLGKKVISFSDNDLKKIGKTINGIPVISVEEMVMMKDMIDIVIAVSPAFIHELLIQLDSIGINEFYIYQCILFGNLEG